MKSEHYKDLKSFDVKIESIKQKVNWLIRLLDRYRDGLKEISNSRDDMNPLHLKQIAQATLDGEPTTADEENVVYISDVNKEIAIDWKNRDREEKIKKECPIPVKGSRDGHWEPPKESIPGQSFGGDTGTDADFSGPNDPGDEHHDNEAQLAMDEIKMREDAESAWRDTVLHPEYEQEEE